MSGDLATTAATAQTARSRIRLFVLLLGSVIIVMTLPLPFRLASVAFAAGALVMAVQSLRSLSALRRAGGQARGHVAIAVGMGLAAVLMFLGIAEAAFYPVIAARDACLAGANTQTARADCATDMQTRLDRIRTRLENAGQR